MQVPGPDELVPMSETLILNYLATYNLCIMDKA